VFVLSLLFTLLAPEQALAFSNIWRALFAVKDSLGYFQQGIVAL